MLALLSELSVRSMLTCCTRLQYRILAPTARVFPLLEPCQKSDELASARGPLKRCQNFLDSPVYGSSTWEQPLQSSFKVYSKTQPNSHCR